MLEGLAAELSASLDARTEATATVELDGSIGRVSRIDALQSQQIALERLEIQPEASLLRRWAIEGKWKLLLTYDGAHRGVPCRQGIARGS